MKDDKGFWKGLYVGALASCIGTLGMATLWLNRGDLSLRDFQRLKSLVKAVKTEYYEEVDISDVRDGIFGGVFECLDDYSYYLPEEDYAELIGNTNEEEFVGVGLSYAQSRQSGDYRVVELFPGSPAEKAGVKVGDIITAVDGVGINQMGREDVSELIRGRPGTEVVFTVARGWDVQEITVIRENVEIRNAYSRKLGADVGYVKIRSFLGNLAEDFRDSFSGVRGLPVLVLDLRGNSGGDVDILKSVAGQLLPDGVVAHMHSRTGFGEDIVVTGGIPYMGKVYVLMDEYTASCAELLVGALRDSLGATLIGKTTFGKGVTQGIIQFKDGSGVKMTLGCYTTPDGHDIEGVGLEPDIPCKSDDALNVVLGMLKEDGYEVEY